MPPRQIIRWKRPASNLKDFFSGSTMTIHFISPPGFTTGWTPLNISRMKAFLMSHGYKVVNHPLCVEFSHYIQQRYGYLKSIDCNVGEFGYTWHEMYFSALLFQHQSPQDLIRQTVDDMYCGRDIFGTVLSFDEKADPPTIANRISEESRRIHRYCSLMRQWIHHRIDQVDWGKVDVVGFSCLQSQFLTNLYIAREIRKKGGNRPRFIFGGAMFRPDNVDALLDNFPEIQHVIVGEGEMPLLQMFDLLKQGKQSPRVITNLAAPFSSLTVKDSFGHLDKFPPPDFDELKAAKISKPSLTTYMGKGCSHWRCSFCPNDEKGQHIRPVETIFEEIKHLVKTYNTSDINFSDLEINGSPKTLEALCDLLITNRIKLEAWGEINARHTSIKLFQKMKKAGIAHVQVGIESFSDRILQCMEKPATVMDNIKVLKYAAEAKMSNILFNLLCNHPLASDQDIEETYRVIRLISHLLRPPAKLIFNEIELYRTSDLFSKAGKFKVSGIKDYEYYRRCYPESALKTKIAMFNLAFERTAPNPAWRKIYRFIKKLRKRPAKLQARRFKTFTKIYDSRNFTGQTHILSGLNELVLRQTLDGVTTPAAIAEILTIPEDRIVGALNLLVKKKLVFERKNHFLGLPLKG